MIIAIDKQNHEPNKNSEELQERNSVEPHKTTQRLQLENTLMQHIQTLWKNCFHEEDSYIEFYFQWKTNDNTIYVICEDETVVSMVHLNPYQVMVGGKKEKSYYIVGVATDENYRKRGLMRRVLSYSLLKMYEESIGFTYLMPASESIYLPFDFRFITHQIRKTAMLYDETRVKESDCKQSKGNGCSIVTDKVGENETDIEDIKFIRLEEAPTLMKLESIAAYANAQFAKGQEVYTHRDAFYYERMIAEMNATGGAMYLFEKEDTIIGYASYMLEEATIEVVEYLCDAGIESWLFTHLYEIIGAKECESDAAKTPMMMARIIHLEHFISNVGATKEFDLIMGVIDPILFENTGVFKLAVRAENTTVNKLNLGAYTKQMVELQLDIATLTQFFFGMVSVEEVLSMQSMHCEDDVEILRNKLASFQVYHKVYLNEIV